MTQPEDNENTEDTTEVDEDTEVVEAPGLGWLSATLLCLEGYALPSSKGAPREIVSDDDREEHRALLRSYTLDLHHILQEDFSRFEGEQPQSDYLICLNNFTRSFEDAKAAGLEWMYKTDPSRVARDLYLNLCNNEIVLQAKKDGEWPPPKSKEDLQRFVQDYLANVVFTDRNIDPKDVSSLLGSIFLVISFNGFRDRAKHELNNIGVFYEYLSKSLPRGVNGYPMFTSLHVMSKADWIRCVAAIKKHHEATKSIEV